jgi:hypothetical protein
VFAGQQGGFGVACANVRNARGLDQDIEWQCLDGFKRSGRDKKAVFPGWFGVAGSA